jgi:hypothetical protein
MAITGYFLDEDWEYHEILLGFEHLHGSHSGANLSEVLLQLLQEHLITDRVLAVTTRYGLMTGWIVFVRGSRNARSWTL